MLHLLVKYNVIASSYNLSFNVYIEICLSAYFDIHCSSFPLTDNILLTGSYSQVDAAIIEVGLGGKEDSTNVVCI